MDVLAHAGSHVFRIEDATFTVMTALKLASAKGRASARFLAHRLRANVAAQLPAPQAKRRGRLPAPELDLVVERRVNGSFYTSPIMG
jgi:hypothetical protein